MVKMTGHFDGRVIVPDEPLALKANQRVRISVEPMEAPPGGANGRRVFGQQKGVVMHMAADFDEYLGDEFWGLADEAAE